MRSLYWRILKLLLAGTIAPLSATELAPDTAVEQGRRMYQEGLLPSRQVLTGYVEGDVSLNREQVICATCHRRSGMGASEGQTVIPAVVGELLFKPLRLPTSNAPMAPVQRPAYTEESLKRAIREGIGPDGEPLGPLMPRYALSDGDLDRLIAYLNSLSTAADPGVTETEIHFATIVADSAPPTTRQAMTEVLETFIDQKNQETRHESDRAAHAPWHMKVTFGSYRKWVLHRWQLTGPSSDWPRQLQAWYRQQPVFAVLSGLAPGSWQPIHDFCQSARLPCLFPNTDLPVTNGQDFYSIYLSSGMSLEGRVVGRHLADDGLLQRPLAQLFRRGEPRGEAAAAALREAVSDRGGVVRDIAVEGEAGPGGLTLPAGSEIGNDELVVLWLDQADSAALLTQWAEAAPERIYLSSTLLGDRLQAIPASLRDQVCLVYPHELPAREKRLLARSTGWLRGKRIFHPDQVQVQANTFFALKSVGEAVERLRGYFLRDYLLEQIEHMVDYASYSSVYPRISLAPGQRFVVKGSYIAKLNGEGEPVAITDWLIP